MSHRIELSVYGIPLPNAQGRLGARRPKIPGLIAGARGQNQPVRQTRMPQIPSRRQVKSAPKVPRDIERDEIETRRPRDILSQIALSAQGHKRIVITYTKASTGERVNREIEPYSIRLRPSKARGRARYLYGFHNEHGRIESYLVSNISNVEETDISFSPRWTVEF